MIKLRYLMVSAIVISILSLIMSIVGLTKRNDAGRYYVFKQSEDGILVYVIDTKTSHLFMRSINPQGKAMYADLGTLDKPQFVKTIVDLQPRNSPVADKAQSDIFDQVAPRK